MAEPTWDAREAEGLLNQWIAQYGELVNRTCWLYLGDKALAEDATQDVFLSAWRHIRQFQGRNGASPHTWLIRIAINTCRNYHRSAWHRRLDRSVTPEDMILPVLDEERDLLFTVQSLPDRYRQIIILRYYHNLSLEEAAVVLGWNRSTAYHRLHKALERLKIDLTEEGRKEL